METIHVVLASDDRYAPFLGVTIYSILKNAAPEDSFFFHVMDGGISDENQCKIESLKKVRDFELRYYHPDFAKYSEGLTLDRSVCTCARFFLPELLPTDVERCLYLDADILVLDSLRELWETDLGGKSIAAAPDSMSVSKVTPKYPLALEMGVRYFNTGVLVLDLKKLRENFRLRDAKNWFSQHSKECRYVDQDAINRFFDGDTHFLNAKWNVQRVRSSDYALLPFLKPEYIESYEHPSIIHFIGKVKPWNDSYLPKTPKALFEAYLAETPWRDLPRIPVKGRQKVKRWLGSRGWYQKLRTFIIKCRLLGR